MTLIIGFGHKARHGKDEAVKAILAECPTARRYSFADALKREVTEAAQVAGGMRELLPPRSTGIISAYATFTPFPAWVVYDPDAPMDDPLCPLGKQRTLLQWWGTSYRRAQDPDYWVKRTMARIVEDVPEIALISDLRFPNEVDAIRAAGGYIVRVDRVGFTSDVPEHVSERALDHLSPLDWDYVIKGRDGDLGSLREEAINAFHFLVENSRSQIDQ